MATSFFSFLKQHKLPSRASVNSVLARPLTWYGAGLYAFILAFLVTLYVLLITINSQFLVAIAARGGSLTEGMIGAPHVINPVLATTPTDQDLSRLLFSGLVRRADNGELVPDLAESYTVSPDGATYTFVLYDKAKWSDGKPLTSLDVAFTFSKLASPALHPDGYWQGITVTTPDDRTVVLHLTTPHTDFLDHLIVGIIPQHIWGDVPDEAFDTAPQNLQPVGSGLFKFVSMDYDDDVPQSITLKRNNHARTHAFIDRYYVEFFANQKALLSALQDESLDITVDATSETAASLSNNDYTITNIETPNVVGLYQSESSPLFINQSFIEIINAAIDKQSILDTVEQGYGILSSIPTDGVSTDTRAALEALDYTYVDDVLTRNGAPITFSMAVENDPTLLAAARAFSDELARLGIKCTIKAYDYGTYNESLNGRQFAAVFASTSTISGYTPVWTIYTKSLPLITSTYFSIPSYLETPIDRYLEMDQWHTRVNRVWKPFTKGKQIITTNN